MQLHASSQNLICTDFYVQLYICLLLLDVCSSLAAKLHALKTEKKYFLLTLRLYFQYGISTRKWIKG